MNLQQLEYIVAVDKYKHFSKAAESCHVTQATLSAMVKKLEKELNLVIFDRKCTPIVTTDCGQEIVDEAKKVIHHSNQLVEIAKSVKNKIEGQISIGIIPTVANALLPIILKSILHKYPKLKLEIQEITTQDIIEKLKKGSLDMGILSTPLHEDGIEENILYYETMMVYGINDTNITYLPPKDLENTNIWLLEEGNCFRDQTINFCKLKEKQAYPSNLSFEANSFDTLINLTDAFGGFTIIPELYHKTLSKTRKSKTKSFEPPFPVREISIVFYRPFAKLRIIERLTEEIQGLMKGKLISEKYSAKDLAIIGF